MADKEASLLLKIKSIGEDVLDRVVITLGDIGSIAKKVFDTVVAQVEKAIHAWEEHEQAVSRLSIALVNQGVYSTDLRKKYEELAAAIQKKTSFSDDEVLSATAILQGYSKQKAVSEELIKATTDLAAAKKIDLASAADILGKAIQGNTSLLKRQGIAMSETTLEANRQSEAIRVVEARYRGFAESTVDGYGKQKLLKNAVDDVYKIIGQFLQPVVTEIIDGFLEFTTSIQNNETAMTILKESISGTYGAGVLILGVFKSLAQTATGILMPVIQSMVQLLNGEFKQSWETLKTVPDEVKDAWTTNMGEAYNKTVEMHDKIYAVSEENAQKEKDLADANRAAQVANRDAAAEEDRLFKEEMSMQDMAALQARYDLEAGMGEAARLTELNNTIQHSKNKEAVLAAHYEKRKLLAQAMYNAEFQMAVKNYDLEAVLNSKRVQDFDNTMQNLSRLQNSKNKNMVAIGKAAAIAHIGIDTARGAVAAWASLAPIPIVGPALGAAAAAALIAYGAEQISNVNSVQMAEGGIVRASQGGTLATIGEAGKDEAVIPLEDGQAGIANNITIVVNGGMLGDENSARELARALDRELVKLQQSNESLSLPGVV